MYPTILGNTIFKSQSIIILKAKWDWLMATPLKTNKAIAVLIAASIILIIGMILVIKKYKAMEINIDEVNASGFKI